MESQQEPENKKPDNEQPESEEAKPDMEETEEEFGVDTTPPTKKKSKKKLLLLLLILLLLAAAGGAYYWFFAKNKNKPEPAAPQQENQKAEVAKPKDLYFYIADSNQPKEYTVYNVKTKEKTTKKLDLDQPLITNSLDSNNPLQITSDGSIVGYATGTMEDLIGGSAAGPKESSITLVLDNTPTKIVTYKDTQRIYDWTFSNDKSTVYYTVIKDENSQKLSLYKYDIGSKANTLIKENVAPVQERTRLYAVNNKDVRLYSAAQYKIKEYAYTSGTYGEKDIPSNQCIKIQCSLGFPQALSPDGQSLLLVGSLSNAFEVDKLTISDGTFKQLDKAGKNTESIRAVGWTPDNKKIAADTAHYGNAAQQQVGFEVRLDVVDVASGTITKVFTDKTPGISDADKFNDHFIELLSWSLDNNHVAFVNNNVVKLFNVSDNSITDTGIAQQNPVNSGTSYGWISQ